MYCNEGLGFVQFIPTIITAGTTLYTYEQQRKIAAQQAAAAQAQAAALAKQAEAEKAKAMQAGGFKFPATGTLLLIAVGIPAGLYMMSQMKGR